MKDKILAKGMKSILTFEKVLEVFEDYLAQDTDYEVVLTRHGYTVMEFDNADKNWGNVEYCETPEDMRDALLDACENYLEYTTTLGREDLTESESADIQSKLSTLKERCRT